MKFVYIDFYKRRITREKKKANENSERYKPGHMNLAAYIPLG